ncbi:MAG: HK97 family phage prohead protease [Alphaproteobacteria bacterium]|nr:HK97 family phage prohead protease [Alphaproteobacteria bacterium]
MSALKIAGYASLFDLADLSGDVVARGAFTECLRQSRTIPMLYQHEATEPIGRWTRLVEDAKGLWVEGEVIGVSPRTCQTRQWVERGVIDGLSIGFRTRSFAPRHPRGRVLTKIDLWEVSVVTFPMLPQARLQITSMAQYAA